MNLIPGINKAYDDDEAGLNHESTKSPLFYNVYLIAQLPLLDMREVTLFMPNTLVRFGNYVKFFFQ